MNRPAISRLAAEEASSGWSYRTIARVLLAVVLPFAWLEAIAFLNHQSQSWSALLLRLLAVVLPLGLIQLCRPLAAEGFSWRWRPQTLVLVCLVLITGIAYSFSGNTYLAWVAVACWFALLGVLDASLLREGKQSRWYPIFRVIARAALALLGGFLPIALLEIESRFADEEFFAFVQAAILAVFCFLLLTGAEPAGRRAIQKVSASRIIRVDSRLAIALLLLLSGLLGGLTIVNYQASFYSGDPPTVSGISAKQPFLCSTASGPTGTVDDAGVYRRLLARVAANPNKTSIEYGMLALAMHDRGMAEAFRKALLAEAEANLYTGPAGSVKYGQHDAAFRAYYYPKVRDAFAGLFNASDEQRIQAWFAAINRRSLTAEWVDWMYAVAFRMWPGGPYENQENGAGLLAILEVNHLSDPALSASNRAYLQAIRGWSRRFRNTDDAYFYQTDWLANAYFQSLYAPDSVSASLQKQSFEWLLQQATPDGSPVFYNSPGHPWSVNGLYLAAKMLHDPRYVWLADKALAQMEARGDYLTAQPGLESPAGIAGSAPDSGSCLLYGNAGLPNQEGPLAPDKAVLRTGWQADATYLLLNLRFTGWHRYKATNNIIALNQGGPLVAEDVEPESIWWLPKGRSALRDKRIPRENLNGLLIPSVGLASIFERLGFGSIWQQDPPFYARVASFSFESNPQRLQTVIDGWHGWTHTRTTYMYQDGPVVVIDSAEGGQGNAAISWHVSGDGVRDGDGIWLRQGNDPARLVLADNAWANTVVRAETINGEPGQTLLYTSPDTGKLRLASVFLTGRWANAQVTTEKSGANVQKLVITNSSTGERIEVAIDGTVD